MRFAVYGPFELPRKRKGKIADDNGKIRKFWKDIDDEVPGLPNAIGCYVFCVYSKPWYVGRTTNSFQKECYKGKLQVYENVYDKIKQGKPQLFFLAQENPSGKGFRKPPKDKRSKDLLIHNLEVILIGMALEINPDVLNKKDTVWRKNLEVEGFLWSKHSRGGKDAKQLRKMFGMGKRR